MLLLWDNRNDASQIASKVLSFSCTARIQSIVHRLIRLVSTSEVKLWIVPRIDCRQIDSHRHAKDLAFPHLTDKELPPFVAHAKALWDKCYHNETQQQPSRPTTFTGTSGVRFLSHSSIKSGWDHLKAAFHQLGKVRDCNLLLLFH